MIKNIMTVLLTLTLSYSISEASCFGCTKKEKKGKLTKTTAKDLDITQNDTATQTPLPQSRQNDGDEPSAITKSKGTDNLGTAQTGDVDQKTNSEEK